MLLSNEHKSHYYILPYGYPQKKECLNLSSACLNQQDRRGPEEEALLWIRGPKLGTEALTALPSLLT